MADTSATGFERDSSDYAERAAIADEPTAAPVSVWYYLDPASNENRGPYDERSLAGCHRANRSHKRWIYDHRQPHMGCWQRHLGSLKDIPELYSEIYRIGEATYGGQGASSVATAGTAVQSAAGAAAELAATTSSQPVMPSKKAVTAAAAAVIAKPSRTDAEMAAFQAEMAALGADANEGEARAPEDEVARADTPPPDEQTFEDDDGTVYQWDRKLRKFLAKDEPLPGATSTAPDYDVEDMTFEMEEEKIPIYKPPATEEEQEQGEEAADKPNIGDEEVDATAQPPNITELAETAEAAAEQQPAGKAAAAKGKKGKKRSAEDVFERIAEKQKRAKEAAENEKKWFEVKVNTSVYISGLPDDVTEAELAERFAQYGVVKPSDDGAPKVKVYRDKASGIPKGDGLVTYLYEPSVMLACKLADDDFFRPGMVKKMSVQPAKFEMHGSEYVPKKKPNKKKSSKKKALVDEKILGWGGFDDMLKPTQVTVILKNVFEPNDFVEEPTLLKDLEGDILEECSKLGKVEKVRIFSGNQEGVVSVKFKLAEPAEACIKLMQGRFFGGRRIEASMWDGYTNYKAKLQETPEQQAARLERFAAEIEAQPVQIDLLAEQQPVLEDGMQQENGT